MALVGFDDALPKCLLVQAALNGRSHVYPAGVFARLADVVSENRYRDSVIDGNGERFGASISVAQQPIGADLVFVGRWLALNRWGGGNA